MPIISGAVQTGAANDNTLTAKTYIKQRNLRPDEQAIYDEEFWNDGGPGARSALEKYGRIRSGKTEN